jgi:hypothetical protein
MNFKTKLSVLLLASSTLALAAPFTNGGFDSPGGGIGGALSNGSTVVTGWTYTGSANNVFYSPSGSFGILAGGGTHYITFGGNFNAGGVMSQTFDTISGTTYNVNYLVTTQQGTVTSPFQTNSVQAFDGATLLAGVNNSLGMANGTWLNGIQLTFTAASSSTTLRFTDTNSVGSFGGVNWGLDSVTVAAVDNGNAVPEPATYALVLASLGAIAFHRRKR